MNLFFQNCHGLLSRADWSRLVLTLSLPTLEQLWSDSGGLVRYVDRVVQELWISPVIAHWMRETWPVVVYGMVVAKRTTLTHTRREGDKPKRRDGLRNEWFNFSCLSSAIDFETNGLHNQKRTVGHLPYMAASHARAAPSLLFQIVAHAFHSLEDSSGHEIAWHADKWRQVSYLGRFNETNHVPLGPYANLGRPYAAYRQLGTEHRHFHDKKTIRETSRPCQPVAALFICSKLDRRV